MITKSQSRNIYFLDRDTDIEALLEKMFRVQRAEALVFLRRMQERLQEKSAGEYFTVEEITKVKEGELEKTLRFFRGAVVPYFFRQEYDFWEEDIPSAELEKATDEIKRRVGFMLYDTTGHITEEVNSMTSFERLKDLVEWLKMVEEVCFTDNGYIFPESKHYLALEKEKGREAARRQTFQELREQHRNRHYKREA